MAVAEVQGAQLFYEVDGDGPPLYVLHGGLGLDHQLYRRSLLPLAGSRRCVWLDQRGNGRSERVALGSLTMEQLADDVVGLADVLGDGTFAVLGHSYGGFVAQEVLVRHPGRVERAVLVDTSPGQLGTGERAEDTEPGPALPSEALALIANAPTSDEQYEAVIRALLPYYLHRDDAVAMEPLVAGTIFDAAAMLRGFEVLAGWSSVDRLASVRCPVLVVAGRHDAVTTWPQAHRIARRIAGAELAVFEESGHFPWIEEPDAFFEVATRFLDAS